MKKTILAFALLLGAPLAAYEAAYDLKPEFYKFSPTILKFDDRALSPAERRCFEKLIAAAAPVNRIFMQQLHPQGLEILKGLKEQYRQTPTPDNGLLLDTFWSHKEPFDGEHESQSFLKDFPPFYPGRNFYRGGVTPTDLEKFSGDRGLLLSDFTIVEKIAEGMLQTVPYSKAYESDLKALAGQIKGAARELPKNSRLRRFLELRSLAFLNNDYEGSEAAWIDVNGPGDEKSQLEVVVGPYENYNDEMMKAKAAFQFYLLVKDPQKSAALQSYIQTVQEFDAFLQATLARYVNEKIEVAPGKKLKITTPVKWNPPGSKVTLVAANVAYGAGDADKGSPPLAFNLPNVSAWVEKYGSKKILLVNVLDGKFEKVLTPISSRVLTADQTFLVDKDAFSDHTIRHEVAHGVGPGAGVRERLQKSFSGFEEAKAEIVGLLLGQYLADRQKISKERLAKMAVTYLASAFRTLRFGVTSDHARGKLFEVNRLIQNGAFEIKDGRFRVNLQQFPGAVEKLAMELIHIQLTATAKEAEALLSKVSKPGEPILKLIRTLDGIPVDLRPQYMVGAGYEAF